MAFEPVVKSLEKVMNKLTSLGADVESHSDELRRIKSTVSDSTELQALERRIFDALNESTSEHRGRHSDLREVLASERSAREKHVADLREVLLTEIKENRLGVQESVRTLFDSRLANVENRVSGFANDHRDQCEALKRAFAKSTDAGQDEIRRQIAEEQNERGRRHGALLESHAKLKQGVDEHMAAVEKKFNTLREQLDQHNQTISGERAARSELEEKLTTSVKASGSKAEEAVLSKASGDLAKLQASMDDKMVEMSKSHAQWQADLKAKHSDLKAVHDKHAGHINAHAEMLSKINSQSMMAQKHSEKVASSLEALESRLKQEFGAHKSSVDTVGDRLEDFDRRHRAASSQVAADLEAKHNALGQSLANLEQKLRAEIGDVSNDHSSKHNDVRSQVMKITSDLKDHNVELRDHVTRIIKRTNPTSMGRSRKLNAARANQYRV